MVDAVVTLSRSSDTQTQETEGRGKEDVWELDRDTNPREPFGETLRALEGSPVGVFELVPTTPRVHLNYRAAHVKLEWIRFQESQYPVPAAPGVGAGHISGTAWHFAVAIRGWPYQGGPGL